jgi:hypothetical protein
VVAVKKLSVLLALVRQKKMIAVMIAEVRNVMIAGLQNVPIVVQKNALIADLKNVMIE